MLPTHKLTAIAILSMGLAGACSPVRPSQASGADPGLEESIAKIRAVDNHTHANSVAPGDADADALPLDGIAPFEIPAPLRPDNPAWIEAYRALYRYSHADLTESHLVELRAAIKGVAVAQGEKFPAWVLDQTGIELLLANRIAMGPGLTADRFRWVSYADPLMLPLSSKRVASTTPDRAKLFPLEDALLRRYLADLNLSKIPPTLDAYLTAVVTPTLEAQRRGGCVAVKFEAAYLRALDFGEADTVAAARIYARFAGGGDPAPGEYKTLQDFLFRYVAREAGRLGMAVHIHAFEGAGNYFSAAGADPLLLEPVLDDPALRATSFVIIHGGGAFAGHTTALLWKPNVYADTSLMTLAYPPDRLAAVLKDWLRQFPEKVLFGSDAVALGPDMGWEVAAWVGTRNARAAVALALTDMMRRDGLSRDRAGQIATMVMRANAMKLYQLDRR
jgi:predicted TIM-barrel fold metal-dependent hydrolase